MYFYVYYGNSETAPLPYGTELIPYSPSQRDVWDTNNMRIAYTFGDEELNNLQAGDPAGTNEEFVTTPLFSTGLFGVAINTNNTAIATDNDDEVALTGSDISLSFMFKPSVWENKVLVADSNGTISINLNSSGKITATIDGVSATTTATSTIALSLNQWHFIHIVYDTDTYIWIDGVKEYFGFNDGSYADDVVNNEFRLNTGTDGLMSHPFAYNRDLTDDEVISNYNNFFREDFFSRK